MIRVHYLAISVTYGDPAHDMGDVVNNADVSEDARIKQRLIKLRRLLFAHMLLLHYSEPIPSIKLKGITGS
jgi:hypothetical protein